MQALKLHFYTNTNTSLLMKCYIGSLNQNSFIIKMTHANFKPKLLIIVIGTSGPLMPGHNFGKREIIDRLEKWKSSFIHSFSLFPFRASNCRHRGKVDGKSI